MYNFQVKFQIIKSQNIQSTPRYSEKKLEAIQRIPTVVTDGRKETSHVSGAKANAANRVSQTVKIRQAIAKVASLWGKGLGDSAEHGFNMFWLSLENLLVKKSQQEHQLSNSWKNEFSYVLINFGFQESSLAPQTKELWIKIWGGSRDIPAAFALFCCGLSLSNASGDIHAIHAIQQ